MCVFYVSQMSWSAQPGDCKLLQLFIPSSVIPSSTEDGNIYAKQDFVAIQDIFQQVFSRHFRYFKLFILYIIERFLKSMINACAHACKRFHSNFLNIVLQQFDFLQTTLLKEIIFTIKQNIPLIHKSFANVEEGLFLWRDKQITGSILAFYQTKGFADIFSALRNPSFILYKLPVQDVFYFL